jgi:hypothetical protein
MKYGKIDLYTILSSITNIEVKHDRLRLYTNGFGCAASNRNAAFADYIGRILTNFGAVDYTVDFNYTNSIEWYDYIDLDKTVIEKFYDIWFQTIQKPKKLNNDPARVIEALADQLRSLEIQVEIYSDVDDDDPDDPDDDLDYDDVEGEDGVGVRAVKLDPTVIAAMNTSQRTLELLIRAAPTKKIKIWLESELKKLNDDINQLNKTGNFT